MIMSVRYTRVGWQDAPSTDTPIDAANLNHMDNGILALSEEVDTELPLLQEQINDISEDIDTQIDEKIPPEVSSWLTEHVDPVGSAVVVDDSLTIQGAAADAKKTGDEISDLKDGLTEISENYDNLYNYDLVQLGKNWTGGSATNRAVAYVAVEPTTTYYVSVPVNEHISAVQAIEKAQNTGSSSNLHLTGIVGGNTAVITTTANTNYFCLQFDGTTTLTSADFDGYDVLVCKGSVRNISAVDKVARADIADLNSHSYNTFYDLASAQAIGISRVGGYEVRNIVEHPYAAMGTAEAHQDAYYDVTATAKKYSSVNYNRSAVNKNILNNLEQEEIDFTPSNNGFTRIIVGKNSKDQFFVSYVASNRTGAFGNADFDALEVTSDFVHFETILHGCNVLNTNLCNSADWQVGKNWTGGSATNRAVNYVAVSPNTEYYIELPSAIKWSGVSVIEKSTNTGGGSALKTTNIDQGTSTTLTTTANTNYLCIQLNGTTTLTSEDVTAYNLFVCAGNRKYAVDGIVVPDMTNLKVDRVKEFADGTYVVAIRCRDTINDNNYTHFYRMSADFSGISHCTYIDFDGNTVPMVDEFGSSVYDWSIFVGGSKALATTYGNRNPLTDYGRVWYTENCGYSWKQVFQTNNHLQEGQPEGTTVEKAHTHGVMIDPYTNRLFVLVGEDNSNIFWTDKGYNATDNDWNIINIKNQPFYNFQTFTQVVNGYPFKDGLVFGSDNEGVGCVYRINKLDNGSYSAIESVHEYLPNKFNGTFYCAAEMSRRDLSSPLLMCATHENCMLTEANNELLNEYHKARIVATYDGFNFTEIWSDDTYGSHDAYINGSTVSRNYSLCSRGMNCWLLKNGDAVIKYVGRDYYYFGGDPMFSVTGLSNGSCKVRWIKNAEKYL